MSLFQELILISLGKRQHFSRKLTENDWTFIYTEAQRQSLVGILLTGVEIVVGSGESKPNVLMQWIANGLQLENRNRMLNARCKEITGIFNDLGFRSCVLKGQGVALLYPNPLRRQSGDIDLWVKGNRNVLYNVLKTRWAIGETVIHHADVKIFNDIPTEIHFVPSFVYNPFLYRKYKKFFNRLGDRQFANYDEIMGFAYPTPDFNAIYSLMHILHHVLHEGIGLRQFLDYYYILKSLDKKQRLQVLDDMEYLGLVKFAEAVMYVERQMFELEPEFCLCQPNERLGKRLLAEIEMAGNFGKYDERYKDVNRKKKMDLYLHNVKRNFVFFELAPCEVLWAPIWKPCHFFWRKLKGYF